jgi:hypothetical protein
MWSIHRTTSSQRWLVARIPSVIHVARPWGLVNNAIPAFTRREREMTVARTHLRNFRETR